MSDLNINASSEILNDFEWQLCRLVIMIETMEEFTKSVRDLHSTLKRLLEEVKRRK
jgi:hypothetical protein